jgi:hypothetical protein
MFLLKVWILMEDVFRAVTGTQEFQYGLHRDPLATDRRFTIAISGSMVIRPSKKLTTVEVMSIRSLMIRDR